MKWENIVGLLAGIIGLLFIAFALFNGPIETKNQPPKQTKIEAPKAPEAPVRAGGERYHPEQVGLAPRMGAALSRGGADLSNRRHPRYSPRAGRHSFALRA